MSSIENDKIRMRFEHDGSRVLYKVLFKHPMHTRFTSKDHTELYITDIRFFHADKLVMHNTTSINLSSNFLLSFYLLDVQEGDKFNVVWKDNLGHEEQFSTKIIFYVPTQE